MSPSPVTTGNAIQGTEDRLRALYNAAGLFGVTFEPKVTLSVDAGDLTSPGCNEFRGRRFAAGREQMTFTNAPVTTYCFAPAVAVVITRITTSYIATTGNNTLSWRVLAGPVTSTIVTPFGLKPFTEFRNNITVSKAPFSEFQGTMTGTGSDPNVDLFSWTYRPNEVKEFDCGLVLPAGWGLQAIPTTYGTTWQVNLAGYVF